MPFSRKRTRDPLPSYRSAPRAKSSASISLHMIFDRAGSEYKDARVLRCLLFTFLLVSLSDTAGKKKLEFHAPRTCSRFPGCAWHEKLRAWRFRTLLGKPDNLIISWTSTSGSHLSSRRGMVLAIHILRSTRHKNWNSTESPARCRMRGCPPLPWHEKLCHK